MYSVLLASFLTCVSLTERILSKSTCEKRAFLL